MKTGEIERFEAIAEDGTIFVIRKMGELVSFQPLATAKEHNIGPTALQLLDGRHVNQKAGDALEIFDTGQIIKRRPAPGE